MSSNPPPDTNELIVSALKLPETDRIALARVMLESVEDVGDVPQNVVDEAWEKEIARRVGEIESGKVKTIPSAELWEQLGGKPNDGD